jgi:hypothetical protein
MPTTKENPKQVLFSPVLFNQTMDKSILEKS